MVNKSILWMSRSDFSRSGPIFYRYKPVVYVFSDKAVAALPRPVLYCLKRFPRGYFCETVFFPFCSLLLAGGGRHFVRHRLGGLQMGLSAGAHRLPYGSLQRTGFGGFTGRNPAAFGSGSFAGHRLFPSEAKIIFLIHYKRRIPL